VPLPAWAFRVGAPLLDAYHRHPPVLRRLFLRELGPDFRELQESALSATVDRLDRGEGVSLPQAPFLPLRPDARHLASAEYVPPPDFVARCVEATYCSTHHVLIDRDRQIIRESCNAGKLEYFQLRRFYDAPVRRISGPTTFWRMRFFNYYHLLVEALPRLLALERTTLVSSPADVQLLCPGGMSETDRFFLARLGLDRMPVVPVEEGPLYTVQTPVLSSLKTQLQSGYLPQWYVRRMQERLCPVRPSTRSRRLFVSRERAARRRVHNQAEVLATVRAYGFESIVLEELSPQEQIEALYDAEAVIAPHGAGLTNLLFGRDLRVLELFPSSEIAPHYVYLAASLGHRYAYLLGTESTLNPTAFTVDIPALDRAVEALLSGPGTAANAAPLSSGPPLSG